jgi:hypothetical protein
MIWIADVTGITEVWIAAAGGGVLSFWGGPNLCFFRHAASPAEALGGLIFFICFPCATHGGFWVAKRSSNARQIDVSESGVTWL